MRALTRLLIGGGITGVETLIRQLRAWEEELEEIRAGRGNARENEAPFEFSQPSDDESLTMLLRYCFIGWLVESEARAIRRISQAEKITRGVWQLAEPWVRPWLRPLHRSRILAALRQRYLGFQARGEDEVKRWIALGRQEELRGRDLARLALKRTVDQNIAYLAHNPEVEQLVETQSSGLANEVVEEVRERTVSADTFLEGLARSLLRKVPRANLPEPSDAVRKMAEGLHTKKSPTKRQQ
jgi:hypothetical protein